MRLVEPRRRWEGRPRCSAAGTGALSSGAWVAADHRHPRIQIAAGRSQRLELLGRVVAGLGYEVVGRETRLEAIGAASARGSADVGPAWLDLASPGAQRLLEEIVAGAACPVVALLSGDPPAVREATRRGVLAYIADPAREAPTGVIDIALRRSAAYHSLHGAFGRRAMVGQAEGILMVWCTTRSTPPPHGRGCVSTPGARCRTLDDVASALVLTHLLLGPPTHERRVLRVSGRVRLSSGR